MADSILALLEPGEYVINKNAAKKIGKEALDNMNYEMMPRFQNGGSILGDYLQGYQTGGPVSYGGYESELPSLDDLYERFGIQPNAENLKRFQEYDPSREGVYREDYSTAMGGLRTTGQRGLGTAYAGARGGGGFAGSGFGQAALSQSRRGMMQDYLQGQRGAYGTMFKGVRGERERWMTEVGGQLGALEEAGGTDPYGNSNNDNTITMTYDDCMSNCQEQGEPGCHSRCSQYQSDPVDQQCIQGCSDAQSVCLDSAGGDAEEMGCNNTYGNCVDACG
jgi:hypothetical protein